MNQQISPTETILIVDDNPTNLNVLFTFLHEKGFKVLIAENGESAIERGILAKPDIILLDILMPGIDGFETCRRLQADPVTQDIPVILMTALNDTTDKVKGFAAGAVDYITKPAQYEEVLARVNTHLRLRHLQENLQTQIREYEHLTAELNAYAHTVAHDLKTPLGSIIGFAELLEMEHLQFPPEQITQLTQHIRTSGEKMKSIIDGLLLLASVRLENVPLHTLNTTAVLLEAEARLSELMAEYQVQLKRPSTWPPALGYAPWIEEVWVNYLSNAIKYGGSPPIIEIGSSPPTDGMVRFWIQDNGAGLSPDQLKQLFTPFTRIDHSTKVEGHGIGLSIVQRIITRLGGQVGAESVIGQGSRFHFTLPAAN
ncbi:MAG: hybrid sensor histidine kinase/response regulator [Ardenticatenaceae bacterium]|nr:hybrid sensor histidine kinase/response regulator [Anaerolineales bacterium]MCB8921774.1 hybrid sensor histidine kinase/response regulator [Ardenticatenaceae bacterium]MCB8990707.1 hybrid sensor histidine kinase/response regulator [Ardenticatenaceae bacterium]